MNETDPKQPQEFPTSTTEQATVVQADLTGKTLGEFKVERLLGRGGMGDVYLATQTGLNRHVAIKVLRADFLSKPAYLSRFEIEATAIAKLNHPNIVHVYTLGCIENIRFIAMEYVQGTNLKDYVIRKGALDLPLAFSIMRQAGQAIAAAAEVGLIHRDIKPENILLTRKGRVKVADFGLCRDQEAEPVHLTQPGVTMGTPSYMSPEQAQGHQLDHRSDLYSLGVTFYYMLAGVTPFRGDTALALAIKHVKETAPNLRVHRPDIPVDLDLLVMKLMAKNPNDRFQSATEMLAELNRIKDKLQLATSQHSIYGEGTSTSFPLTSGASAIGTGVLPSDSTPSKSLSFNFARIGKTLPSSISSILSWRTLLPTFLVSTMIGVGAGWMARSPDLITGHSGVSLEAPGIRLAPDWRKIPRMPSAEQQYRRAQFQTRPNQQVPAWVAVSANFPGDRTWATKSYIQLGRHLFQEKDKQSLAGLADDLERWKDAKGKEPLKIDYELAQLLKVGAKLIERVDLEGVVAGLDQVKFEGVYDTTLLELGFEIVSDAKLFAERSNSPAAGARLARILGTITPKLFATDAEAIKLGTAIRNKPPG